jgi:ATP-binding cassette subfamily F protein 3
MSSRSKKKYLGINYFLEQRMENMREVEKKMPAAVPKESNKASMKIRKRKALQNKLSKVESQIKQLEKTTRR